MRDFQNALRDLAMVLELGLELC